MKRIIPAALLSLAVSALAFGPVRGADDASIDGEGVLRWRDGREVAVMGVNYYAPFWGDYRILTDRGIDIRRTIDDDIQHFRRLGLDCLRLHAIDREISTEEGALVDNEHLALLDYLLAAAVSNGMHVVLTPIAWFSGPRDGEPKGFSQVYPKDRLCSEEGPERIVRRFLKEFVSHVNRHTGVRYADEPGILAFECFNEPRYAKDFTDAQLTAHVTRLADAIRSTGTTKPVLYSIWQGRSEAIGAGKIDGVTVSSYPNDIQHGCETELPKLDRVRILTAATNAAVAAKAKIAYEFDSADTCCSYMMPAIARMFRSVGVQAAAMFQYDELPIASENAATRTHYLNLVHTPGKAIGMAIAAEVFRRVPRLVPFVAATNSLAFPPFRVDRTRDCAELAATDLYYYTNGALTPPPDPARLKHVWGVGRSEVVMSRGTGAYFLDRLGAGRWRLQLYPDVFRTADPFTGRNGVKVAALDRKVALEIRLPDLGGPFALELAPGDYVLTRGGGVEPAPADLGGPRFILPPQLVSSPLVNPRVPRQMRGDRATDIPCATVFASAAALSFSNDDGETVRFPVKNGICRVPARALKPGRWYVQVAAKGPNGRIQRPTADDYRAVWHPLAGAEEISILPGPGETVYANENARLPMAGALPPQTGPEVWKAVLVNEGDRLAKIETGFVVSPSGEGFGTVLAAAPGESLTCVQPEAIQPLWKGPADWTNRWGDVRQFSMMSGKWLFRDVEVPPQNVRFRELKRVRAVRGWPVDVLSGPGRWNFFDAERYANAWLFGNNQAEQSEGRDAHGDATYRLRFSAFAGGKGSFTLRQPLNGGDFQAMFPDAPRPSAVVVRLRALTDHTDRIEFVLYDEADRPWGKTILISTVWQDVRIPISEMRYFGHWTKIPEPPEGTTLDARRLAKCAFTLGAWLFRDGPELPHEIEISAIRAE